MISQSFKVDELSGELQELISDKDSDILALYDIASQILPNNEMLLDIIFQYALGATMNYV